MVERRSIESPGGFDLRRVYDTLDAKRRARGLSWAEVSHDIGGISPSTLSGLRTRRVVEADGVLQILRWLQRTPESFVADERDASKSADAMTLPEIDSHEILRFDTAAIFS